MSTYQLNHIIKDHVWVESKNVMEFKVFPTVVSLVQFMAAQEVQHIHLFGRRGAAGFHVVVDRPAPGVEQGTIDIDSRHVRRHVDKNDLAYGTLSRVGDKWFISIEKEAGVTQHVLNSYRFLKNVK